VITRTSVTGLIYVASTLPASELRDEKKVGSRRLARKFTTDTLSFSCLLISRQTAVVRTLLWTVTSTEHFLVRSFQYNSGRIIVLL